MWYHFSELIHTASLLHDDVIDNSNTRRGVKSTNAEFGNKLSILGGFTNCNHLIFFFFWDWNWQRNHGVIYIYKKN